jgi:hypothetical protein
MWLRRPWARASLIGLLWGGICFGIVSAFGIGAADFTHALGMARDLLARRNPYSHTPGPYWIPYPLPAAFLGLPVAWLPDAFAGAAFIGISTALLSWGILRSGEKWRLGMLCSWPFVYAVIFAQWSPLLCAIWFFPLLSPLLLAKPNIALPLVLTAKPRWLAAAIAVAVLALSLALRPGWPWEWLSQIREYQGLKPPILILPFGPLILASLLCWRDRRAWLILSMAMMPQRAFYDQLALLLVARSERQLFPLVASSWISFLVLWASPNMAEMPGGPQFWMVAAHYLPAVGVLLWPQMRAWRSWSWAHAAAPLHPSPALGREAAGRESEG